MFKSLIALASVNCHIFHLLRAIVKQDIRDVLNFVRALKGLRFGDLAMVSKVEGLRLKLFSFTLLLWTVFAMGRHFSYFSDSIKEGAN